MHSIKFDLPEFCFVKLLARPPPISSLLVQILFAAVFSFARMVGGPYLTYLTLTAGNPPLIKVQVLGVTESAMHQVLN